ncbi:MAG: hypothetical protein ROO73_01190 [Roseivirga sp.]
MSIAAYLHKKPATIQDALSIAAFEKDMVVNKDGSLSIGFALALPEEELLDPEAHYALITALSDAITALPTGTALQKIDAFDYQPFLAPYDNNMPFFWRKTLERHHGEPALCHQAFLFLRFFSAKLFPTSSFLALGNRLFKHPFLHLHKTRDQAQAAAKAFIAATPKHLALQRLSSKELENLLYRYLSLTFHRQPLGFERNIATHGQGLLMEDHLEGLHLTASAEEINPTSSHHLGAEGIPLPFAAPLAHLAPFPHLFLQQITRIDEEHLRKTKALALELAAQLKVQDSERARAEHKYDQLLDLEKNLDQHHASLVELDLKLLIWHPSSTVLQERSDFLKNAAARLGLQLASLGYETMPAFLASAPGATGFHEGLLMPTQTAVAHLNLISPRKGDHQGILLQDRHQNPLYYDPFKFSLDNQHAFVFGPSGSGKSFFNGKMIKDRFYEGHTVVVIDSGGTYRRLFEALGGKYIEYKPLKPLRLNPFFVPPSPKGYLPTPDKIAFLTSFIAKMWKGNLREHPLSELEYALLANWLSHYYQSLQPPKDIPHLSGFCLWLEAHLQQEPMDLFEAQSFFIILSPFTKGIYKDHFNALSLEHLPKASLLCFELEAVKADQKLYPLLIQVLFDYVVQLTAAQPTEKKFIDIEEGWSLLDQVAEQYIEAFFRKGRKTGTSIRIITQNVDEIKRSKIANALRANASTFILLRSEKASVRDEVADFLGMSAFERAKYAALRRKDQYIGGYREVLIKEMDRSAVWKVGLSLYEHALLTSRPDERHEIEALTAEEGGSLERGITRWVEQRLRAERREGETRH